MVRTLDRVLDESEKTGLPVPESASAVVPFTALDWTVTAPVTFPDAEGEKFTEIVQLWPTFNVAGTVGKFGPQLLVSP